LKGAGSFAGCAALAGQAGSSSGSQREPWVVIPAYNEEASVGDVVAGLVGWGWPVVVVDDGSTDGTQEAARGAGARVLRHVLNLGQGAALQTGIDFAVAQGAERIVTFDADGQHEPADIPALLAALDRGADVALGSRFLGGMEGASRRRKLFLRIAVAVSNAVSGIRLSDAHCGLRAFRASAAPALRITQERMAHASELLRNIRTHRLRVVEVPITVRYTEYSQAKGQGMFQGLRILFDYFFRRSGGPPWQRPC
jgi:glycosyltransferase involved in cell wall biosynthesis